MTSEAPPPTYTQELDDGTLSDTQTDTESGPQILIIPTAGTINFQKGYLGAEGERAAIEGELQVKGADSESWNKVTVSLHSLETAFGHQVELGYSETVLYSRSSTEPTPLPSSFLFAIPLTQDTPQTLRTTDSNLSHTLTVSLHPVDDTQAPISKSIVVHTRRYTSHLHSLLPTPETHILNHPTRVEVEIPRSTFKIGERIPIYVTIPPPNRELVLSGGLRLRNVRAELIRIVRVKRYDGEDSSTDDDEADSSDLGQTAMAEGPSTIGRPTESLSQKPPKSPLYSGSRYRTIITRSGASCRFHSSRSVQLRFALLQSSPSASPSEFQASLPPNEYGNLDSDSECPAITQTTVLHSITFNLDIHVSFVDTTTRTERLSTVSIPITMLPASAPLPEVEQSVDDAYQKKHDRPPARTVREDEYDSAPRYFEGEAGPSGLPGFAPPPFEERDAPPPFFSSAAEASTSNRLPTFLESESEIILPHAEAHGVGAPPSRDSNAIEGEGITFGFLASAQFDGHSDDMQHTTPPPSLEMASHDTNLTDLADIREPERVIAIEALGLVLDQHHEEVAHRGGPPPPPPPAMDDPSDPPPSIDSDFRVPDITRQASPHPSDPPPSIDSEFRLPDMARQASPHPRPTPPPQAYAVTDSPRMRSPSPIPPPPSQPQATPGHAPPPYLGVQQNQDQPTGPPPYVG
ncbi:hypothetical protein HGRIS_007742 [Hohenbuehelia grisea]|uniref:Arrestin C-terminal-like domain-containing protein n=1 Tax=Hohenbuehelia grisea TaxID=104357 RepID=A0ABR3J6K1_9AGAR